jgi:hypothetical protein
MFIPDPGCLSRILIFVHSGSRIQKQQKKRGEKISCPSFSCSNKNHKIENYNNFELVKKKCGLINKELQNFLPKKLSLSSQECSFGVRDERFGITKKPIPDLGSRGQKGTGSGIRNTEIIYTVHGTLK